MDNKKKLCKLKQNCPKFLSKVTCDFDHVECKFKDGCNDKQKCRFYHIAKQTFDKPKSQTLCKYNGKCTKNGCPFKHQQVGNLSQNKIQHQKNVFVKKIFNHTQKSNKICRFGQSCMRKDCLFQHPNKVDETNGRLNYQSRQLLNSQNQRQTFPKRQIFSNQIFPKNNMGTHFSQQRKNIENRYCIDFILNNQCINGQNCQKLHEFTQKSSIKRIFFSNSISQKNTKILFYQHSNQQRSQQRQIKQIIYIIQKNDTISFKKLISAQNLYEQYGGIDRNQQNKTYLRSVTPELFKAESNINGLQFFNYNNEEYLIFIAGSKINIYNTTKGKINYFQATRPTNKITGCLMIQDKSTLLVSTLEQQLKRFEFNNLRQQFEIKPLLENFQFTGLKKLNETNQDVLGQKIIYGINAQENKLILMNKHLKPQIIQFPEGTILNDAQIFLLNNKIPSCIVSISKGSRQHQVVVINLINFQKQSIMQYQFNSGLGKIKVVQGHLLVEIKNKGLLIYRLNEFEREIGMIPFLNEIKQIQADDKGNMLILQGNSVESKGSLSIYKVKKI